jgi:hypothetical protein
MSAVEGRYGGSSGGGGECQFKQFAARGNLRRTGVGSSGSGGSSCRRSSRAFGLHDGSSASVRAHHLPALCFCNTLSMYSPHRSRPTPHYCLAAYIHAACINAFRSYAGARVASSSSLSSSCAIVSSNAPSSHRKCRFVASCLSFSSPLVLAASPSALSAPFYPTPFPALSRRF